MTGGANFDRLVGLAGIEPEYWDIWGNHHPVEIGARRAILAALGLPATDEATIAASFKLLEQHDWLRALPSVLVVREGRQAEIPLSLPAARAAMPVQMQIIEESGCTSAFVFRPAEASAQGRRSVDGADVLRYVVPLPLPLPPGYHVVRLADRPDEPLRLIVAPHQCYLPKALVSGQAWGISAQLYTLKRPGNWGIGDFTDLRELVEIAAELGASVIGLNPLHALALDRPEEASPYSPSSRLFLNPLYIDVEAVPEFATCAEARARYEAVGYELAACRTLGAVAYRRVKPIKLAVLEAMYACFRRSLAAGASGQIEHRARDLARFREEQGEALRRYVIFEALSEALGGSSWHKWPDAFHHPAAAAVVAFAEENADRIGFFEYLQWQADRQLGTAQARARELGLSVGIYRDLAVGASRDGADAWADREAIVQQAKVGCPPDPFNMLGQDWGIPPLHPLMLRDSAYQPFITMLRANMRHAGALRIDHVMALMHLFWIPADGTPAGGAYVKYPFEDLLGVLALESQRNRCLVVGEDLGTVPAGFRERMAQANVLSYRVLYFEKDGDRFKRPEEYPALALACISTHDLATLIGFWNCTDLDLKRRLSLYPSAEAEADDRAARRHDRTLLLRALGAEGLLPAGIDPENPDTSAMTPSLMAALHGYLARSPARILLIQIDDLMQEMEQINLPGTVDERPNWRRRLSGSVTGLPTAAVMQALRPALADRSAAAVAEAT